MTRPTSDLDLDLKPGVSDQSHLAETRDKHVLPRSPTPPIGGGPLLRDSDKSRLGPLQIGVSPTQQKLPTSKTCPDLAPLRSVENRLCGTPALLRDSDKSRLSPLQIDVSPIQQKFPASKT